MRLSLFATLLLVVGLAVFGLLAGAVGASPGRIARGCDSHPTWRSGGIKLVATVDCDSDGFFSDVSETDASYDPDDTNPCIPNACIIPDPCVKTVILADSRADARGTPTCIIPDPCVTNVAMEADSRADARGIADCTTTYFDPPWGAAGSVGAGGSLYTGGARPDDPLSVRLTSPNGGMVSIGGGSGGVSGYSLLGHVLSISAPDGTPENPLVIVFTLDASLFTDGLTPADVVIFRNGVAVPACSGAAGMASPDPCLASTGMSGDDYTFTVLTSQASTWVLGAQEASPERTCRGLVATIVGTSGDDTLTGTADDDVIWAGAGDDVVSGLGGRDVICLGAGDDEAHGGGSPDRIFGGAGADSLFGDKGDDTLRGGNGTDTGDGGPGTDRCLAIEAATACEL